MSLAVVKTKKKKTSAGRILFWKVECKYSVIIDRVSELDWKLVDDEKAEGKVNLLWIDVASIHERLRNVQPWQTINHFPGMPNIARKNRMGQNLNKMLKLFPKEYSFYPRTWILPGELADFRTMFDNNGNSIGNKIYIIKPDAGCQGRGIFLTRTFDTVPLQENVVAQLYIKKPLLIDGYKFDLRLYCLVSSVKPLRMYLFQDGLVRMCTEEYVKPTKQNISNVCMHLTNYAVNKHNENFVQPSAKSSEESQDDGSKRSLAWFMNSVRKDRGDAKADWLWRRMGTLCTRTVLSIIPTLSREYDQHFKSFNNVPVDIGTLLTSAGYTMNTSSLSGVPRMPSTGKHASSSSARRGSKSGVAGGKESGGEEEESGDEDESGSAHSSGEIKQNEGSNLDSSSVEGAPTVGITDGVAAAEDGNKYPKMRGSRCFEILGFDIMLDSTLKPWLIEVNHLPSFGTDSPLDKDIKERLMEQVFSVLPVMADDQQAYLAHHKAESEKRLVAQRTRAKQAEIEKEKVKPPARKREPMLPPMSKEQGNESTESTAATVAPVSLFTPPVEEPPPAEVELAQSVAAEESSDDELPDEECSPERLQEIKTILLDVYRKYSPEKCSKIDRLLAKYLRHEEEFLRFVFTKYEVDPRIYKKKPAIPKAAESNDQMIPPLSSESEPTKERALSLTPKGRPANKETSKRYSRSLSPPRSGNGILAGSQKRPVASWKSSGPDEDAAFRAEVLSAHVPDETEEWMQFEQSRLTQFTRIFPLEAAANKDRERGGEEEDARGDEDNEDADDDEAGQHDHGSGNPSHTGGGKATAEASGEEKASKPGKAVPVEEILFQIFVQDKRQTMRLRNPLPNRSKVEADAASTASFLPPLDQSRSSSVSSMVGSGKGAVGWKAPPKPVAKEPLRQPTETQSAAAKRLSQGLSVNSNSARQRNSSGSTASFSVVLDAHELGIGAFDNGFGEMIGAPKEVGFATAGSTKASRLLEERNMNRIRMEAAKASSAAVLRQQVFHFDPNYDSLSGAGGVLSAAAGLQPFSNQLVSGGSLVDTASVVGGGGSVAGVLSATQFNQNSQAQRGPIVRGHGGGEHGFNGATGTSGNSGSNHTQEELLKQLFPSWF